MKRILNKLEDELFLIDNIIDTHFYKVAHRWYDYITTKGLSRKGGYFDNVVFRYLHGVNK